MPVPAVKAGSSDKTTEEQGYSVIYLARGPNGENELRCKYRTLTGWDSEALLQGVESFQVLYGLDRDGDGLPEHFLRASALSAEISSGVSGAELWNRVVAVKIALLMRSTQRLQQASVPASWNLFGADYTAQHAAEDRGTRLSSEDFPGDLRHRLRRSYEQLIFLRNPSHSVVNE
jgi:type IV pilus assembly protein PilW